MLTKSGIFDDNWKISSSQTAGKGPQEKKVASVPRQKEAQKQKLDEAEGMLRALKALQPTWLRLEAIRDRELPGLRTRLQVAPPT